MDTPPTQITHSIVRAEMTREDLCADGLPLSVEERSCADITAVTEVGPIAVIGGHRHVGGGELSARVDSLAQYEKITESGTAGCLSESRAPRYSTG